METAVALDLEQYKTVPIEESFSELAKINRKLEELARDCFEVEKEARRQLLYQKALYVYPKLDISFLSLSAEREWQYKSKRQDKVTTINVPRFSVHRLDEPEMIMRFGSDFGGIVRLVYIPLKICQERLKTSY